MKLDVIERRDIPFPPSDLLPDYVALIHRGPQYLLDRQLSTERTYLNYVAEGQLIRIGSHGTRMQMKAGQLYVSQAGEHSYAKSVDNTPHQLISFIYEQPATVGRMHELWGDTRELFTLDPMLTQIIHAIRDEVMQPAAQTPQRIQLIELYHASLLQHISLALPTESIAASTTLYRQARHALLTQPDAYRSLHDLADQIGVSKEHLIRLFKDHGDTSPYQQLLQAKMKRATQWLRNTDWPISTIANHLGYDSTSSFTRAFSKTTGSTPGATRRK